MFIKLNPLLHSELRLAIMSLLMNFESAEFKFVLEKTKATKGNLSIQITKLKDANYIKVKKSFRNNYPLTTLSISPKGKDVFDQYVENLKSFINLSD
tara:strand:- start:107 stop:397 length:291 start_codon:yes stop_codon:yes gene_type:complete